MIKRFYKISKGDDSSDSSSSSSGSDSDSDDHSEEEIQEDEVDVVEEKGKLDVKKDKMRKKRKARSSLPVSSDSDFDDHSEGEIQEDEVDVVEEKGKPDVKKDKMRKKRKARSSSPASGSGYESEDSSENKIKVKASDLPMSEDDSVEGGDHTLKNVADTKESDEKNSDASDALPKELAEFGDCILKIKSVYKCRICPKIVCLNQGSLMTHLNSKKHARSKKKLNEGRLKVMLNSDGQIEEEQETHEERHIRTLSVAQEPVPTKKKDSGRKRQNIRRKRKQLQQLKKKAKEQTENHEKSSEEPAKNPGKSEEPAKKPGKSEEPAKNPKNFEETAKKPKKKQRKNKTED